MQCVRFFLWKPGNHCEYSLVNLGREEALRWGNISSTTHTRHSQGVGQKTSSPQTCKYYYGTWSYPPHSYPDSTWIRKELQSLSPMWIHKCWLRHLLGWDTPSDASTMVQQQSPIGGPKGWRPLPDPQRQYILKCHGSTNKKPLRCPGKKHQGEVGRAPYRRHQTDEPSSVVTLFYQKAWSPSGAAPIHIQFLF